MIGAYLQNLNVIKIIDINLLLNEIKEKYNDSSFYVPIYPDRDWIYKEDKIFFEPKKKLGSNMLIFKLKKKKIGFPYGLSENNIFNKKVNTYLWKNGGNWYQLSFIYISWNIILKFLFLLIENNI